jgi:hypothetical protein
MINVATSWNRAVAPEMFDARFRNWHVCRLFAGHVAAPFQNERNR